MNEPTYYGRLHGNKPKIGVEYFMLEEHIKLTLNTQKEIFKKECQALLKTLKRESLDEINGLKKELVSIKKDITTLSKANSQVSANDRKNSDPEETQESKEIRRNLKKKGIIKE